MVAPLTAPLDPTPFLLHSIPFGVRSLRLGEFPGMVQVHF